MAGTYEHTLVLSRLVEQTRLSRKLLVDLLDLARDRSILNHEAKVNGWTRTWRKDIKCCSTHNVGSSLHALHRSNLICEGVQNFGIHTVVENVTLTTLLDLRAHSRKFYEDDVS
jgi:hypothetical protein